MPFTVAASPPGAKRELSPADGSLGAEVRRGHDERNLAQVVAAAVQPLGGFDRVRRRFYRIEGVQVIAAESVQLVGVARAQLDHGGAGLLAHGFQFAAGGLRSRCGLGYSARRVFPAL